MDITKLTITELNALKKEIDEEIDAQTKFTSGTEDQEERQWLFREVYVRRAPANARAFKSECVCHDDYTDGTYAKLTRKVIGPTWRLGDYDTFIQISGRIGGVIVFEEI